MMPRPLGCGSVPCRLVTKAVRGRRRRPWCSTSLRLSSSSSGEEAPSLMLFSLWRHHRRTHLVFGANTGVGKTVVTAALVRAGLLGRTGRCVRYVKPLQCGGSDQAFVEGHVRCPDGSSHSNFTAETLFRWETPASPHTACHLENEPVSDEQLWKALTEALDRSASFANVTYLETAGGVLSPSQASPENGSPRHAVSGSWGWMPQADLYQPLAGTTPVILVGDGRLGGISCTLSALESLLLRGYDVACIILLEDGENSNAEAIRDYVSTARLRSGTGEQLFTSPPTQTVVSLPPLPPEPEPLFDWYESDTVVKTLSRLDQYLHMSWEGQVSDWKSALREETQSGHQCNPATWLDSASGDSLHVFSSDDETNELKRSSLLDADNVGGLHGDPAAALACAAAAGRYGSVSSDLPTAPAAALRHALLAGPGNKGWAHHVHFAESRSAAVEAAFRVGLLLYQHRMGVDEEQADEINWVVCAQEGAAHGATLGAASVSGPDDVPYHPWYEPRSFLLETPSIGFVNGALTVDLPEGMEQVEGAVYEFDSIQQALDVDRRSLTGRKLHSLYKEMIEMQWLVFEHSSGQKIGSVVLEPVLMSSRMKFVDPLWQRALIELSTSRNVPIIFDETNSGLYGLGVRSCREILMSDPDVATYSTGGIVPLNVVLTSNDAYEAAQEDGVLGGLSPTAPPVGCVSALHHLDMSASVSQRSSESSGPFHLFDEQQVKALSELPPVEQSFALGTVLTVSIRTNDVADETCPLMTSIVQELHSRGVFVRPVRNVICFKALPLANEHDCQQLATILLETIQQCGDEMK